MNHYVVGILHIRRVRIRHPSFQSLSVPQIFFTRSEMNRAEIISEIKCKERMYTAEPGCRKVSAHWSRLCFYYGGSRFEYQSRENFPCFIISVVRL
jgi:hypothetical protein